MLNGRIAKWVAFIVFSTSILQGSSLVSFRACRYVHAKHPTNVVNPPFVSYTKIVQGQSLTVKAMLRMNTLGAEGVDTLFTWNIFRTTDESRYSSHFVCELGRKTLTFGVPECAPLSAFISAVFVGRWPRMQIINEVSVYTEIRARVSMLPR